MITPMMKYHFLLYHRDYPKFLEDLRELGVFHVVEKNDYPESIKDLIKDLRTIEELLEYLEIEGDPEGKGQELPRLLTEEQHSRMAEVQQMEKERNSLREELRLTRLTLGEFAARDIEKLRDQGIYLHLFSCKPKQWTSDWDQQFALAKIHETSRKIWFVAVTSSAEKPDINAQVEVLPGRGSKELEEAIKELNNRISRSEALLNEFVTKHKNDLLLTLSKLKEELRFNEVEAQGEHFSEDKFVWLESFVPKKLCDKVESELLNEVYFEKEEPSQDDRVPIELKNNQFSKLFEPVGNLFSLPSYSELDLTPLFAPFFLLFFGFCLGDAGYGLIIVIGLTIFGKKIGNKSIVRLAQLLGSAAIVFGAITGTIFGVSLADSNLAIPEDLKSQFLNSDQLFNLSLSLGGLQIIYGMVVKMVNQFRQFGFVYMLSTFGWILLVIGLGMLGLNFVASVGSILSWAGVGLILLFNDPKANIFVRFGKGLWELYGITGVFGDLLSYIRLFALGLSSSILGLVINEIGLSILGSNDILGPIFFVIFLLIGHTLNLFIASLGAFVHPMRLTFVEFYKNAGFTGGGVKYSPFKKQNNLNL